MKKLFLFTMLFVFAITITKAQDDACFEPNKKEGIDSLIAGNYSYAINRFRTANICEDRPLSEIKVIDSLISVAQACDIAKIEGDNSIELCILVL